MVVCSDCYYSNSAQVNLNNLTVYEGKCSALLTTHHSLQKTFCNINFRGGSGIYKIVRPGSGCGHPIMCVTSC